MIVKTDDSSAALFRTKHQIRTKVIATPTCLGRGGWVLGRWEAALATHGDCNGNGNVSALVTRAAPREAVC